MAPPLIRKLKRTAINETKTTTPAGQIANEAERAVAA
jgi:hypothetical protein